MKHLTEEQLILFHYGEDSGHPDAKRHVAECAQCQQELRALRSVLGVVSQLPVPQRDATYGGEVWRQISPILANESVARGFVASRPWFHWLRWATAACALVAAAYLLGRYSIAPDANHGARNPTVANVDPSTQAARLSGSERILLGEIGDHLERSQRALIDLLNSKTNGPVNIGPEQTLAGELVAMNRLYRQALHDRGESQTASVLDDLERSLMEIANSPADLSQVDFAALRQRVGGEGLLFRVKIVAEQLRAKDRLWQKHDPRQA